MKSFKTIAALAIFLFVGYFTAQAQTVVEHHAITNTSITLPVGWEYETEGDILVASDNDVMLLMFPLDVKAKNSNVNAAIDFAEDVLSDMIPDLATDDEISEETLNGYAFDFVNGDGTYEGKKVEVEIAVLRDDAGIILFSTIVPANNAEKHFKKVDAIYSSVR